LGARMAAVGGAHGNSAIAEEYRAAAEKARIRGTQVGNGGQHRSKATAFAPSKRRERDPQTIGIGSENEN